MNSKCHFRYRPDKELGNFMGDEKIDDIQIKYGHPGRRNIFRFAKEVEAIKIKQE
jgi:hypothetical protein